MGSQVAGRGSATPPTLLADCPTQGIRSAVDSIGSKVPRNLV